MVPQTQLFRLHSCKMSRVNSVRQVEKILSGSTQCFLTCNIKPYSMRCMFVIQSHHLMLRIVLFLRFVHGHLAITPRTEKLQSTIDLDLQNNKYICWKRVNTTANTYTKPYSPAGSSSAQWFSKCIWYFCWWISSSQLSTNISYPEAKKFHCTSYSCFRYFC